MTKNSKFTSWSNVFAFCHIFGISCSALLGCMKWRVCCEKTSRNGLLVYARLVQTSNCAMILWWNIDWQGTNNMFLCPVKPDEESPSVLGNRALMMPHVQTIARRVDGHTPPKILRLQASSEANWGEFFKVMMVNTQHTPSNELTSAIILIPRPTHDVMIIDA